MNVQFCIVLAFVIMVSISVHSWMPIGIFVGLTFICVPLSIWVRKWNVREDQKMLEEFPYDPEIQAKYGKKK